MEPKFKIGDVMTELIVVMKSDSKYAYRGRYNGKDFLISKDVLPLLKELGYIKTLTNEQTFLLGKPDLTERFDPDTGESVGYRIIGIEDKTDAQKTTKLYEEDEERDEDDYQNDLRHEAMISDIKSEFGNFGEGGENEEIGFWNTD